MENHSDSGGSSNDLDSHQILLGTLNVNHGRHYPQNTPRKGLILGVRNVHLNL